MPSQADFLLPSADPLWDHPIEEFIIYFPGEIKFNGGGSMTRDDHYLSAGAGMYLAVPQLPADRQAHRKWGQRGTPASRRISG